MAIKQLWFWLWIWLSKPKLLGWSISRIGMLHTIRKLSISAAHSWHFVEIITLWRHWRHEWRHAMTWRHTMTSWCYVSRLHLSWQSKPVYVRFFIITTHFVKIITLWRHGRDEWRHAMTWRHTMTSWCYVSRLHLSWQSEPAYVNGSETQKIMFFLMATLTFDLWPWHSNLSEILSRWIPLPNFGSVHETVQAWERWQTDRQTDGTDFIPSTADAGGKNELNAESKAF